MLSDLNGFNFWSLALNPERDSLGCVAGGGKGAPSSCANGAYLFLKDLKKLMVAYVVGQVDSAFTIVIASSGMGRASRDSGVSSETWQAPHLRGERIY